MSLHARFTLYRALRHVVGPVWAYRLTLGRRCVQ